MDKSNKKLLKKIILIIFVAFCIVGAIVLFNSFFNNPYRGTVDINETPLELDYVLSSKEAKEDLEYTMSHLKSRHPLWLEKKSDKRQDAEVAYKKALNSIKDGCTVLELYKEIAKIDATLHDGHTSVYWAGSPYYFINDFTQLKELGAPLTINGISTQKILQDFKQVHSYELDFYVENIFYTSALCSQVYLMLCSVDTSNGVTMEFNNNGKIQSYHYNFVPIQDVVGYEVPEEKPNVSYNIDKENNIGIFELTSCVCDEVYTNTLDNFFAEIFSNNIQNVVVDLRDNGGGNSWVANTFLTYVDVDTYKSWDSQARYGFFFETNKNIVYTNNKKPKVFAGNIYVLTDINTYSAAMDFAMLILDNNLGTVIGEPSGNLPDSYGDVLRFQLPNSKLNITVSYKKWSRIDKTKAGEPITPNYQVESKQALNKVYELVTGKEKESL